MPLLIGWYPYHWWIKSPWNYCSLYILGGQWLCMKPDIIFIQFITFLISRELSFNFAINRHHLCPVLWVLEMASSQRQSDGQRLGRANPKPNGVSFTSIWVHTRLSRFSLSGAASTFQAQVTSAEASSMDKCQGKSEGAEPQGGNVLETQSPGPRPASRRAWCRRELSLARVLVSRPKDSVGKWYWDRILEPGLAERRCTDKICPTRRNW